MRLGGGTRFDGRNVGLRLGTLEARRQCVIGDVGVH
jgi:hypothetical protein